MNRKTQGGLSLGKPAWVAKAVPTDWLDVLPAKASCLRDYQRQLTASIAVNLHAGVTRILLQLVTGGGKTHIIATVADAASQSDLRVLILATRTRLIRQIHERLHAFDVRHGVIAATLPELRNYSAKVQIASVDTLYRRAVVDKKMPLPPADVLIFDEAHLATADSRLLILDSYPMAQRIGFTATPARKSGRSLGAAFDSLILGPTTLDLTYAGVLVPARIFNTPIVTAEELKALPKDSDNDFKTGALGALLTRPKLVGDIVTNSIRIANRKRTVCFATNKAHAAALLDSFRRQGVAAEMLTDADDETTREEVMERLKCGATTMVINCFLLAYGVDLPEIECVILARPTRSLAMYLQMVGRGLRSAPGKTHCIVIDHGHVVENLGLPQSDYGWTLDAARNVNAEARQATARGASKETARTCGACSALWLTSEQGNCCPECGWTAPQRSKSIAVEEADLQELADDEDAVSPTDACVVTFYREAVGWYARRWPDRWLAKPNSGRGWAARQTWEKFRIAETVRMPPRYWTATPLLPSNDTAGWLQHRLIKWNRSHGRAAA